MKGKRLTIEINRPIKEVFDFTLDPKNTPKWIDGIAEEVTSEWPSKKGTIYKNKDSNGTWNEYVLVEFEKNKTFTLARQNSDYHVRYTFYPVGDDKTEFEYYEWVESGELDDTVSQQVLEKLKKVIENED